MSRREYTLILIAAIGIPAVMVSAVIVGGHFYRTAIAAPEGVTAGLGPLGVAVVAAVALVAGIGGAIGHPRPR